MTQQADLSPIAMTADLVSAYVSNNHVSLADLPALIVTMHAALTGLAQPAEQTRPPGHEKPTPAEIRKSITHDALMSFEDGRRYKTLRRHLATKGLTPETYRTKWGLPNDYPMIAASYSAARSEVARQTGLGRIGGRLTAKPAPAVEVAPEPVKRAGRPRKGH